MNIRIRALALGSLLVAGSAMADPKTAQVQVIHNSADPAAAVVDVYVNGDRAIDDFAFRAATPFLDLPANTPLQIGVAPGTSTGPGDILATFDIELEAKERYVVVANGVLDPSQFAANPDGRSIGFDLYIEDDIARGSKSTLPGAAASAPRKGWDDDDEVVRLLAFHGATDAPAVDIWVRQRKEREELFEELEYGQFSKYRKLEEGLYILDLAPEGSRDVLASFEADLRGLGGGAAIVFASGFLSPSANQNGPAFGLFAALADGQVVELLPYQDTAQVQVIHNSADPAAAVVDVYVNGDRAIDDFAFRAATPFLDLPANTPLQIGVAPGTSTGPGDILATFDIELEAKERYVVVANGVLDPSQFAANPDGRSIGFDLYIEDDIARGSKSTLPGAAASAPRKGWDDDDEVVRLLAFHGATDAPAVDIWVRQRKEREELFEELEYGQFSKYRKLEEGLYILDLAPEGSRDVLASFEADLRGLGGGAAIVFASGFLSPSANQNGPAFGLFAALADGQVVELLPYQDTAQVQVIHNSADPAAAVVDVYVNGDRAIDDFAFRAATPFLDLPANTPLQIGVAPGTSTGPGDILATFDIELEAKERYVVVANGVLDPSQFAANPDGRSIGFDLYIEDDLEKRIDSDEVEVLAFHGSTDAPGVDIWLRGSSRRSIELFGGLRYGKFKGERTLSPVSGVLDLAPAGTEDIVASFEVDLTSLGGGSAVVFASGFFDPAANGNGAAFGLFAALPDGSVLELQPASAPTQKVVPEIAGVPTVYGLEQNTPNPFNPTTQISFALPAESRVSLRVFDVRGRLVTQLVDGPMPAGRHSVDFQGEGLASGTYFYLLEAPGFTQTRKMLLVK